MSGQTEIMWGEEVIDTTVVAQDGADNWKEVTLADVVSKLGDGLHGTPKYDEQGEYPFINGNNLLNGKIVIKETTLRANEEEYKKHKKDLSERTILVSINGTLGNVALYNNEKCILGKSACYFNVLPEVDRLFIKYVVTDKTFQDHIRNFAHGTTIQNVSLRTMREYPFLLPTLPEQKSIVGVLSSLDDKIDLLQRQNATLEALAETLFRQWFVEEAKEEWEDGAISDIIDFNPTYRLKKGELATYLEMSNVSSSTFNPSGWYKREFNSGTKFKNGDTLLARITPCLENGKTAFVSFLEEDEVAWGSTEYIIMRTKPQFHPFLSYVIARNSDFRDFAISSMSGSSGRQRVQTDMLAGYDIKIPDKATIQKMNEQLEAISNKLISNAPQIETLSILRDTLLPKLMSGEVRVAY